MWTVIEAISDFEYSCVVGELLKRREREVGSGMSASKNNIDKTNTITDTSNRQERTHNNKTRMTKKNENDRATALSIDPLPPVILAVSPVFPTLQNVTYRVSSLS